MPALSDSQQRILEELPRRGLDPRFERRLLKRGLGLLRDEGNHCVDCQRTPLAGERVHEYERTQGIVCELCRGRRPEDPSASRTVHHSEHGHTVRPVAVRPAVRARARAVQPA